MSAFLDMGGYGVFVWSAYGLTAMLLAGLVIATRRARRRTRQQLDTLRPARRRQPEGD